MAYLLDTNICIHWLNGDPLVTNKLDDLSEHRPAGLLV